jgi:hypothetical protein
MRGRQRTTGPVAKTGAVEVRTIRRDIGSRLRCKERTGCEWPSAYDHGRDLGGPGHSGSGHIRSRTSEPRSHRGCWLGLYYRHSVRGRGSDLVRIRGLLNQQLGRAHPGQREWRQLGISAAWGGASRGGSSPFPAVADRPDLRLGESQTELQKPAEFSQRVFEFPAKPLPVRRVREFSNRVDRLAFRRRAAPVCGAMAPAMLDPHLAAVFGDQDCPTVLVLCRRTPNRSMEFVAFEAHGELSARNCETARPVIYLRRNVVPE